ncbi:MAG: 23S rRNA (pseudouridine(1915)-N(3))-methyltransferase RlmH [Clostridiales bacterium]|nr:23S rRNA (pseudouridine(1915)-N(3))-methyltransferase RlmH [Clostridiales bacterium]
MLKINLVTVGNLKDKFFIDACGEYEKRLSRFCVLNIKELKEFTNYENIEQIKYLEGEEIIKNLKGYVVLLDVKGTLISSEELACKINDIANINSEITFVIGGSYGVSEAVKQKANLKISMSKMTFPHRLARVMLLEQIYRAFTINNNISYHK